MDIHNSFMDIHNFELWYQKIDFRISIIILWISKIRIVDIHDYRWFIDNHNWFMDIHNWFMDIHNLSIMDIHNSIGGYP